MHKAGQRHFGAAVGLTVYRGLPKWEVVSWVAQVDRRLAAIAATQP